MKKLISIFILCLFTLNINANELGDFIKHAKYESVKISPDGKHLAVKTSFEGNKVLAFLNFETKELEYLLRLAKKRNVGNFYWANNERVVLDVTYSYGPLDKERPDGSLYSVNFDGSKGKYIFGQLVRRNTASKNAKLINIGTPRIISTLGSSDKYIYVSISPWNTSNKQSVKYAELIRLDVYNGKQMHLMRSPGRGDGFVLDNNDEARFAYAVTGYEENDMFYREVGGEWQGFKYPVDADDVTIHGFNENNDKFYFSAYKNGDTGTLYSYKVASKKVSKIYQNKTVSIDRVLRNYKGIPYGVSINEDYSNFLFFTKKVEHAKFHSNLYQSFKGDSVYITSSTSDGKNLIVFTTSDKNPGTYYHYNTDTKKANFLLETNAWLNKPELAEVIPYKFKARDGKELHGYLTVPHGKDAKNLPLVVNPHGGPHGPRDYWGFDWRVQALASKGYAVLQVNFRGSGGYGKEFERSGYLKWGSEIQYDIIDATNWAINSGYADKNRVCIYGGSFGGYSALMSSIVAPDLYKCTIGVSGVYDLPLMYNDGDIPSSLWGTKFLDKVLGGENEGLLKFSPVHQISRLKAPVLVIHGTADLRTPISQANSLIASLEAKKHDYSTLIVDDEYHGFINEDNRLEAVNKIVNFLDEHIGK